LRYNERWVCDDDVTFLPIYKNFLQNYYNKTGKRLGCIEYAAVVVTAAKHSVAVTQSNRRRFSIFL
jgi:hypothetical protein